MNLRPPYVELPRAGLVHQTCPCCLGGGEVDNGADAFRSYSRRCGYCAGRGYIVTEAPVEPARAVA